MSALETIVRGGLGSRYTAAIVRVEKTGTLRYERAFGSLDDLGSARETDVTTRFDLASLTKLFVSTAALQAVSDGMLTLDESLSTYLPEWSGTNHAAISLRMLLAHTSGMASGADYRTLLGENVEVFARMRPLASVPAGAVVYSDLGFITLGALLARVRGTSLSRVIDASLASLGALQTSYRPRNDDAQAIPATEEDGWRGRVRGVVHDEKAYLMNGVAGHAGLFGTARDVARLADAYLAPLAGRRNAALPVAIASDAVREHASDPVLRRGLGWALKTSDDNSCGARMSAATFGHTGFTGTVVWADPLHDLSITFLTNAVYYGRHDLRDVRAAVCDAAVAEFAA